MANKNLSIGLKSVKLGDIASDGGMGTTLTEYNGVVSGTAVLTQNAPSTTNFTVEDQETPFYSFDAQGDPDTFTFNLYDVKLENLQSLIGGTITTGTGTRQWNSPKIIAQGEKSVEVEAIEGFTVQIPRAKVSARLTWNFSRTELAQVTVTCTILQPTKADTSPLIIVEATA